MADFNWTDEAKAALLKLRGEGLSMAEIAVRMGLRDRNAVWGAYNRLRAASGHVQVKRVSQSRAAEAARAAARAEALVRRHEEANKREADRAAAREARQAQAALLAEAKAAEAEARSMRKLVASIRANTGAGAIVASDTPAPKPAAPAAGRKLCNWPIGEPRTSSFRYCDERYDGPGSYCEFHACLASRSKRATAVVQP